jgi:RNase P protein component
MATFRLTNKEYALTFTEKKDGTFDVRMILPRIKKRDVVTDLLLYVTALGILISNNNVGMQRLIRRQIKEIRSLCAAEELKAQKNLHQRPTRAGRTPQGGRK